MKKALGDEKMAKVICLQGPMAIGKTTAINYIKSTCPSIHISYENPQSILGIIRERNMNKDVLQDYIQIQRLFIKYEIERYQTFLHHSYVLCDFGIDEVEFHTLYYPVSKGYDWDIEHELKDELQQLRECKIDYIIDLTASDEQLFRNKSNDRSRNRNSFVEYQKNLYPLKKEWLQSKPNVLRIDCNNLTLTEQNELIKDKVLSLFAIKKI